MARILAIDYGTKKTGIAVTDPLQLIPNALETVHTKDLFDYLEQYLQKNEVECIVVGEPLHPDGNPLPVHHMIIGFVRKIAKLYPEITVALQDERHTSIDARLIIKNSGAKLKKQRDKMLVDKVSAGLILRNYMIDQGKWNAW